jgi:hypothetical protein
MALFANTTAADFKKGNIIMLPWGLVLLAEWPPERTDV